MEKKPIYKKWWFWLIAIIVIGAIGGAGNNTNTTLNTSANTTAEPSTIKNRIEVSVVDFSVMSKEDIKTWCDTNKIKCNFIEEYSDSVAKDEFVKQSVSIGEKIYEGDTITITYSLGKEPTIEEKNALYKAQSYANNMHMSKAKIYDQLTSEYGEGFSNDAAQYAIDNVKADWNANALEKAKSYQNTMHMSKSKIYDQLTSSYGENFTKEQAQYAIDNLE